MRSFTVVFGSLNTSLSTNRPNFYNVLFKTKYYYILEWFYQNLIGQTNKKFSSWFYVSLITSLSTNRPNLIVETNKNGYEKSIYPHTHTHTHTHTNMLLSFQLKRSHFSAAITIILNMNNSVCITSTFWSIHFYFQPFIHYRFTFYFT